MSFRPCGSAALYASTATPSSRSSAGRQHERVAEHLAVQRAPTEDSARIVDSNCVLEFPAARVDEFIQPMKRSVAVDERILAVRYDADERVADDVSPSVNRLWPAIAWRIARTPDDVHSSVPQKHLRLPTVCTDVDHPDH